MWALCVIAASKAPRHYLALCFFSQTPGPLAPGYVREHGKEWYGKVGIWWFSTANGALFFFFCFFFCFFSGLVWRVYRLGGSNPMQPWTRSQAIQTPAEEKGCVERVRMRRSPRTHEMEERERERGWCFKLAALVPGFDWGRFPLGWY